jgi:proteic killer suppression protein
VTECATPSIPIRVLMKSATRNLARHRRRTAVNALSVAVRGKLEGLWSVKVTANWRITFKFIEGNAYVVDYTDYH